MSLETNKDKIVVSFPAILSRISTNKDRSVHLVLDSQYEFNSKDAAVLFDIRGNECTALLSLDSSIEDIPEFDKSEPGKSPSQRLRGVLYVLWEQKGKPGTFNNFYTSNMERIIDTIKERLT